jgi:hypothetical protein|tara:strand:+ start:6225 stop:6515 length:291 start_codon:yes stop_codon:yes gene_type:complete
MRNKEVLCPKTGKHMYPSEAAAQRAMNKYEDIKRIYKCSFCEDHQGFHGWHTTHMSESDMGELGFDFFKRALVKVGHSPKYIKNRIKTLKDRISDK